jgi:hypothetical protein
MPDRLMEAAKIIFEQAKANAGGWSARIPPAMKISGGYPEVTISNAAPPAYPNEVPHVRHPVFGGRGTRRPRAPWVTNQHRPFLAPAGDMASNRALAEFAKTVDDWAAKLGYH